jgi:hypothetical protein
MLPPMKAPKVTAGLTWPPEMLAEMDTATKRPKACARAAATSPDGVVEPSWVSLLNAMPEPSPANTNMRVDMNSANADFRASGWAASSGLPTAIFLNGMVVDRLMSVVATTFTVHSQSQPLALVLGTALRFSAGAFILNVTRANAPAAAGFRSRMRMAK